ncbi:hypothetical protein GEMRC1_012330 [Eukaryota sp. GEM-RC1]
MYLGIEKYRDADNDVAVFDKILNNCIDEEFRLVQKQLKVTVTELLKACLKAKFPLVSGVELSSRVNKKVNGSLPESEWVEIVTHMYSSSDAMKIVQNLKQYGSENMKFSQFIKYLLDYQLDAHMLFLSNFREIFNNLDDDSDGVLTFPQFENLIASITDSYVPEVEGLSKSTVITFSDAVSILSSQLIECD